MVATKTIVCSVDVHGDKNQEVMHGKGSDSGFGNWPLTLGRDQEVEVNSLHGLGDVLTEARY